jgi:tetratricopeptide (TPR) repeat protein
VWPQSADERAWEEAIAAADRAEAKGDYAGELQTIHSALAAAQRLGLNDLRLATAYERLGAAYADTGQLMPAENAYLRSLRIWEGVAPEDAHVGVILMGLTTVYTWRGEPTKAEKFARRAISLREQSLGSDSEGLVTPLQNLAVVLQTENRLHEAREVYDRVLAILKNNKTGDDILVALVRGNLGELLARMGNREDAIKELKAAIAIGDAEPEARRLHMISFRASLAKVYAQNQHWQDAYEMIQGAKILAEGVFGPDHFLLERILLTYADVLRHLNRRTEATAMERRATAIHKQFSRDNALGSVVEAGRGVFPARIP